MNYDSLGAIKWYCKVSFALSFYFIRFVISILCYTWSTVCFFVFIWGDSLLSFRRTPNKGAWSIPIGPCHRLMRCLCILTAPRVWPPKCFVQDKLNFVQDKKYFVRAEGRGICLISEDTPLYKSELKMHDVYHWMFY